MRRYVRPGEITARIARIWPDASERLGWRRRVVERTIPWLLAIRYDHSATTITALATLTVTIIYAGRLPRKDYGNHL